MVPLTTTQKPAPLPGEKARSNMKVETVKQYVAENGRRFDTEKGCLDYEFSEELKDAGIGYAQNTDAVVRLLTVDTARFARILAERINARITKKRGASVYGGGHYAFYASNADSAFAEDFIAWVHANFYLVPKSK